MNSATQFRLPDSLDQANIDAILAERYAHLVETQLTQTWHIYDTFDGRLSAQALMLQWSTDCLLLRDVPHGGTCHHVPTALPPRKATDLPEGAFRSQIAAIIQMRALLEQAIVHTWSCHYRILNKDGKTVVRLIYTEVRMDAAGDDTPHATYLTVEPLRGYAKEAGRLAAYLKSRLDITRTKADFYFLALQDSGHMPGTYAEKQGVHLHPSMPSGQAARRILRQLLEMMRANEAGVKADIDTEFLHDYRIAARRTRSALTLIRKVFPAEETEYFKVSFRNLGQLTNELRDLDVYLLSESDFESLLPEGMREDIAPLFDYLRAQRKRALEEVISCFSSLEYAEALREWEEFLHKPIPKKGAAVNAMVPIIDLARKRIYGRYRKVIREGDYILTHTQDELLHDLRIECKKLRYLMEFFASLFPRKKLKRLIDQLKKLQDNLGEFNDLAVQQEYLMQMAEELPVDDIKSRKALVATGYLVENLNNKQKAVKDNFADTFTQFASPANKDLFRQLFATEGKNGRR